MRIADVRCSPNMTASRIDAARASSARASAAASDVNGGKEGISGPLSLLRDRDGESDRRGKGRYQTRQ
eukprot:2601145-Rhodomonas_salina.1